MVDVAVEILKGNEDVMCAAGVGGRLLRSGSSESWGELRGRQTGRRWGRGWLGASGVIQERSPHRQVSRHIC